MIEHGCDYCDEKYEFENRPAPNHRPKLPERQIHGFARVHHGQWCCGGAASMAFATKDVDADQRLSDGSSIMATRDIHERQRSAIRVICTLRA